LGLAPHRATVLTNKHPPAEAARKNPRAGVGCAPVSPSLAAGLPLALLAASCFLQLAVDERKCCLLVTCRQTRKKTGRGAHWLLLHFKRASIARVLAPLIAQPAGRASSSAPSAPPALPFPTAQSGALSVCGSGRLAKQEVAGRGARALAGGG
jgi:hypothetical protein